MAVPETKLPDMLLLLRPMESPRRQTNHLQKVETRQAATPTTVRERLSSLPEADFFPIRQCRHRQRRLSAP